MEVEYAIIYYAKNHPDEKEFIQVIRENKHLLVRAILLEHPETVQCLQDHKILT